MVNITKFNENLRLRISVSIFLPFSPYQVTILILELSRPLHLRIITIGGHCCPPPPILSRGAADSLAYLTEQ